MLGDGGKAVYLVAICRKQGRSRERPGDVAASPDKRVLDVGIKGQRVRVLGRSGVARLVLQKN